ncbi:hypothetical protein WR25_23881 [Diploscapter pachys]|uniref:Peptidase M12B domain-containing protein n=1 Tax=Diploscapter pachys TaxID=2018661 RepID=A0A2A2JL05_9BILA|nr:hypothetical protein WR25_23881 [Diploscapter pachys]
MNKVTFQEVYAVIHFFTPEELQYTFGVKTVSEVPKYEETDPRFIYSDSGELHRIQLSAMGKEYDLDLKPTLQQLVHPAMTVVHRDEKNGGKLIVDEQPNNCHFHHRSNTTIAAISNCDGRVKGTIIDPTGIHVIHPFPDRHAHRSKRSTENGLHIVYKRELKLDPKDKDDGEFCGLDNQITEEDLVEDESGVFEDVFVTGQRLQQISDLVVELAVFVDEELWRHFNSKYGGYATQKLQDYMLTLLNNIQIMYYQPTANPPLTFKVVRFEVLKYQPSALQGHLHAHGNAQHYLDRFCKYQKNLAVRDWDHAFMLTGYDIHRGSGSRSISGIARLDGMCDPWNTCTLAEGLDFTSAFIGTHELGHSVGMRHDEPYCQSTHIMSASLGPGKVTWSTCSLRDYHQFLQRMDGNNKNCLRISNMPEKIVIQRSSKPGQLYDANMQCELMHGVGYQQVTPRRDHYDGICYMMWCGQSQFGRIITSHPALEGTFCGSSKWCQLGRCIPWTSNTNDVTLPPVFAPAPTTTPYSPRKVDGGWSAWSVSNCDQCTCNPVIGGIGLAISKRTCSNPYPQNGGLECGGSTTRALTCSKPCPTQTQTVDQYITSRCSEHKRIKGDSELTGTGSQLTRFPQRACKIFCDVINRYGTQRNYRFFGDNLPDGTSCGYDKYCLEGECMSLSCNRHALIARDQSCPADSCPASTAPTTTPATYYQGQWSAWSLWSSCTATCGGGYRKRSRACSVYGRCEGQTEETEPCGHENCPLVPNHGSGWAEWTEWNHCSTTCGRGSQARYRKCITSDGRLSFTCPEKNIEVRMCDAGPCNGFGIWGAWSEFSSCSTSCGPGTMVRQRMCIRETCDGSGYERQSCNLATCPTVSSTGEWEQWTGWSECSTVCGGGLRSRSRYCRGYGCVGQNNEQERCNQQPCAATNYGDWSQWSAWSTCSATCGTGVKRRTRYCRSGNCPGNFKESMICNEGDCQNRNAQWGGKRPLISPYFGGKVVDSEVRRRSSPAPSPTRPVPKRGAFPLRARTARRRAHAARRGRPGRRLPVAQRSALSGRVAAIA